MYNKVFKGRCVVLRMAAWLCFSLGAPTAVFAESPRKIALLVGVSKYAKTGLTDLQFAHHDAFEMAAALKSYGFEVTTLCEAQATKEEVTKQFNNLLATARELNKSDVVLVFFAGHGLQKLVTEETLEGPKKVETPFFCVFNSLSSKPESLISLSAVLRDLEDNSSCDNNLLIVDACRDNQDRTTRPLDGSAYLNLPQNISVFWGCSPGQKSRESSKVGHGVFTHFILKGLRGAAANARGDVDWLTLAAYVRNEVVAETPLLFDDPKIEQKPNLVGNHLDSPVLRKSSIDLPPLLQSPFTKRQAEEARQAWAKALGIDPIWKNSVGMEFALIPPGEFMMGTSQGDERSNEVGEFAHRVRHTRPIYCATSEVTQEQWFNVMKSTPWEEELEFVRQGTEYPVVMVTWKQSIQFCETLAATENKAYRLPRESEWEYVCRAGTETEIHCSAPEIFHQFAWFKDNAWDVNEKFSHSVKRKAPNHFGIFDMHGNVAEYCEDFYSAEYYKVSPIENPTGANVGDKRVIRGGSFAHDLRDCRSARRLKPFRQKDPTVGFRAIVEISW